MRTFAFLIGLSVIPVVVSAQDSHYGTLNVTSAREEQTGGSTTAPGFPGQAVTIPETEWISRGTMKADDGKCFEIAVVKPALKIGIHELFRDKKGNLTVAALPPEKDRHGKIKTYGLTIISQEVCSSH